MKLRRVSGDSMAPTLREGQILLIGQPKRLKAGDVVMLHHGGLEKIKRLAKAEGDRIYLLGDNPNASTDSRSFGWLNKDSVVGRLIWPRR